MKKQILFVDDDFHILEGLQRTLRPLRNEWDMHYVLSGAKALELMDAQPIDLIISDMRMPEMNGADLLHEVMKRHPSAIRMILSGQAESELMMMVIGVAHQFISKPCDLEVLKTIIRRALNLRELLNNENLKEALSEMDSLPSVPTLYFELEKELQSSDPSIQNVGNIIGQDPGMTAKILQLANSPFFGLRRSISNPAETVAYLGLDRIQHLFLALHIFSQFKNINSSAFSIELLWEHSLSTAIQAKEIASDEEADKGIREDSFTAGLLHDFGKLLFASKLPEKYDRAVSIARTDNIPLCQAEVKVLGVTHAEIGAYLFGIWGLPNSIVEAVAYHHHPADCGNNVFCSLTALHAADCKNVDRSNPGVPPPQLDIDYLSQHLVKTKSRILSQ